MATNVRVKIGKIGLFTFIRSPGIPKGIAISPFWFLKVDLWWSVYVNCTFGKFCPSRPNSEVYDGEKCTPVASFFKINLSDKLSQHLRPIFTIFTIWSIFDSRFSIGLSCLIARDVIMATIVELKWAKSAYSPSSVAMAFLIRSRIYRNSDFKRFICDDLATSCKNLVNFGPVIPSSSSSSSFIIEVVIRNFHILITMVHCCRYYKH